MHFLVNHTAQHVQIQVVAAHYKPDLFASMLNEDEALVAERTSEGQGSLGRLQGL
jgi:dynamin 1-like protein